MSGLVLHIVPCPFCKSTMVFERSRHMRLRHMRCLSCGATGPDAIPGKTAEQVWNERAWLWQPIEMAPKDVAMILGNPKWDKPRIGYYFIDQWFGLGGDPDCGCVDSLLATEPPTHWMPLPEPPKESK